MRTRWSTLTVLALALALALPARASTFPPVAFSEMVHDSALIVRAVAVHARSYDRPATGQVAAQTAEQDCAPSRQPENFEPSEGPPIDEALLPGVEGGAAIFTEVELVVDEVITGDAPSVLKLTLPGGRVGNRTAKVYGLPDFVVGESYLLFLRKGWDTVGDPVVGGNQGFLRIVTDPDQNEERLVDAAGDWLIGVEQDRFVRRAGPGRVADKRPSLVGPPTPDPGYPAVAIRADSPQRRFWESSEAALTPAQLVDQVRNALDARSSDAAGGAR